MRLGRPGELAADRAALVGARLGELGVVRPVVRRLRQAAVLVARPRRRVEAERDECRFGTNAEGGGDPAVPRGGGGEPRRRVGFRCETKSGGRLHRHAVTGGG